MPAIATQYARLYLLSAETGGSSVTAGVVLHDPSANALYVRLRRDWDAVVSAEEAEILAELQDDLESKAAEMGAGRLLAWMEDTLSNVLRISEPRDVIVEDFQRALARHYRQNVQAEPKPFVTHLPRYTLAVAAGKFLDNQEVTQAEGADGWEEAPVGLRLTPGMFVARIVGQSMEPRIPDGSLCIFRADVTGSGLAGSRQGKLVLVEYMGGGTNDRYTVKRYLSTKLQSGEEASSDTTWTHQRIRLEPLNPAFDAWDLDPEEDRFRVLAEFVEVLHAD